MEAIKTLFGLYLLIQACLSVHVALKGGQTGIVSRAVFFNTSVTLACSVSNTDAVGTPSLQWIRSDNPSVEENFIYRNGKMNINGSKFVLVPPYSLQVNDLTISDTGFYKCRAVLPSDTPTNASATYNLTVLAPSASQISCDFPDALRLEVGSSAEFTCGENITQAYPAPVYKWFKDNKELPMSSADDPLYANSNFSYNMETGVLEFGMVVDGDAGDYYCNATNKFGSEQCMEQAIGIRSHSDHPALSSMLLCLCSALFLVTHKWLA